MKRMSQVALRAVLIVAVLNVARGAENWDGETVRFYGTADRNSIQFRIVEGLENRIDLAILVPSPSGALLR